MRHYVLGLIRTLLFCFGIGAPVDAYMIAHSTPPFEFRSHTYNFPDIPYRSGVHHIHSPEYFLEAHGLCAPGFRLTETAAPVLSGVYVVTAFKFRTLMGPMEGRLFSSHPACSEFMVLNPDGEALLLGQLKVERCGVAGHSVRAYADWIRHGCFLDRLGLCLARGSEAKVRAAIQEGYRSLHEDSNLRLHRCRAMYGMAGPA